MADVPDTRVRLSAEGLAELLAGLRQIRVEAQKTANETGKSFEGMNTVLEKGTQLLELFGITAGVAGLVELTRHGAEAASTLEDLAASTSLSTEELQGLQAAANEAGIRTEKLTTHLDTFQRKLDALQSGDDQTKGVFKRLGLDPQDLKGKSVAESIDIVASSMAQLRSGAAKTTISNDLFGKSGARLIPVLDKIAGSGGLGAVIKAAKEAGIALDHGTIESAARVEIQLHKLQAQSTALAIVFASELGPALIDTLSNVGTELGNLSKGVQAQGPGIRFLIQLVDAGILVIGEFADALLADLNIIMTTLFRAASAGIALVSGDAGKAGRIIRDTAGEVKKIHDDFGLRSDTRLFQIAHAFDDKAVPNNSPGDTKGTGAPPADPTKALRDRIALERALGDNELKMSQQLNKAQQDVEKRRFDDGLTSLQDYYSRRRVLIEAAAAAEIAALTRRLDAERQNPDDSQRRINVANLEAEIARRKLQLNQDLATSFHDQQATLEDLDRKQRAADDRILDAQGQRHEKALRDIHEEAAELSKLETNRGVADPKALEDIHRREKLLIDAEEFQNQQELLGRALADLDRERALIQTQVAKGTLSELDGKQQIAALDKARIPDLEAIAALVLRAAQATGDPEKIAQALQLQQQIAAIGTTVSDTSRLMVNFGDATQEALAGGVQGAVESLGDGFDHLGDVGVSAVQRILSSLLSLEAQILASKLLDILRGTFSFGASVGSGGGGFRAGRAPSFGGADGLAGGGLVRGPGSSTSDSIPAWLSDNEHVTRAQAVRQPGVLPLLTYINEAAPSFDQIVNMIANPVHVVDPIRAKARSIARFADGGLVSAAGMGGGGGSSTVGGTILVDASEDLVVRVMDSPRGQKVMLKHMSRRPRTFNRALGRN